MNIIDSSLSSNVPKGYTSDVFEGFEGQLFKRAIDSDGCRWYWQDGEWILNVPWFRDYAPGSNLADVALVDHSSGNHLPCKITKAGTIHIGKRRINNRRWNH